MPSARLLCPVQPALRAVLAVLCWLCIDTSHHRGAVVPSVPQKLLAFEKFLEEFPEWRDKVLLVQIAVPSRTDVPEYQRLRR